jgi:hypothetical protein
MKKLLSVAVDAKTKKGKKLGVLTGILYLAPADISGFEVCPKRTAGCTESCLYTAGRGAFNYTKVARVNKTLGFFENRDEFMATLVKNAISLYKRAIKNNMLPAIRLNGTSDIAWEKIRVVRDGLQYRNIMLAFPDISFYDYSKVLGRKSALALPNYHLTFSMAENNDKDAYKALEQGYNVAVVMNLKKDEPKPAFWNGYPVIDGDETDARFLDPDGGHIVALTAKGMAKKDTSGFVRSANIIAIAA